MIGWRFPKRRSFLPDSSRSWRFGLIALALIAAVLYVLLLANATRPYGGGDAVVGQAFEMLFLAAGLWIVLALMLLVAGLMGSMPGWVKGLAVVLVPTAAVADVVAVDMCSRHLDWAIVLVALLPAPVVFYAFWARLRPKPAPPGRERLSALVWGAVFLLSVMTFVIGAAY